MTVRLVVLCVLWCLVQLLSFVTGCALLVSVAMLFDDGRYLLALVAFGAMPVVGYVCFQLMEALENAAS